MLVATIFAVFSLAGSCSGDIDTDDKCVLVSTVKIYCIIYDFEHPSCKKWDIEATCPVIRMNMSWSRCYYYACPPNMSSDEFVTSDSADNSQTRPDSPTSTRASEPTSTSHRKTTSPTTSTQRPPTTPAPGAPPPTPPLQVPQEVLPPAMDSDKVRVNGREFYR